MTNYWFNSAVKKLTVSKLNTTGRNNLGEITFFHKGGGTRHRYRIIDFKRDLLNIKARCIREERDPNRTSFIALLAYDNGVLSYILSPNLINKNSEIFSSSFQIIPSIANSMFIHDIPIGLYINNIELVPFKGGQYVRAAGTGGQILRKKGLWTLVKLPSGELIKVSSLCRGTVGVLSNPQHHLHLERKAGHSRYLNKRPHVRGVAMNPIDHPMGGGEGKTSGGKRSVSPWARLTKGYVTRSPKKVSKYIYKTRKNS